MSINTKGQGMRMDTRLPIVIGLILISPLVLAEPTLRLHVFDEAATQPSQQRVTDGQLKLHVFDHATAGDDVAYSPSTKPRSVKQELALAYDHADVYFKAGYRRDRLKWNTGLYSGTPNILSELTWDNLNIATLTAGATIHTRSNWLFNVDLNYGYILSGDNQDSDYLGDNRTLEFSRSNNNAENGMVADASIHAGYQWRIFDNESSHLDLIPKLGFSYNAQFLRMTDGYQTLAMVAPEFGITEPFPLGPFAGLDSTYDAAWYGPWVGLGAAFSISDSVSVYADFDYHYAFYDATADWNLRPERAHPESFTHEAEGYGLVGAVGGEFTVAENLSLNLSFELQKWKADRDGVRTLYLADGTSYTNIKFNEVIWHSVGANLGVKYNF